MNSTNKHHRARPSRLCTLLRSILLLSILVLPATVKAGLGQEICLSHTTAVGNIGGHITTIDDPRFNGKPDLKLFITNNWTGTHLDHPISVWYDGSRWNIFNEDFAPMPAGLSFNVIACQAGNKVFAHLSEPGNINSNQTVLDHPLLNGNPAAKLVITRDWTIGATYSTHHHGVWYNGTHWTIYTEDTGAMPADINFNVLIDDDASRIITHITTPANVVFEFQYTIIDHPSLNGNPDAKLVVTHDYGTSGPYVDSPVAVWYAANKWNILREDVAAPAHGLRFNILVGQHNPIIGVGPGGSIQAAIDAASPGDTVEVAPGTYNEDLILRDEVSVVGAGPDATILRGTGIGNVVTANNVIAGEFSGFCITGNGSDLPASGIRIGQGSPLIANNKISGTTAGIVTIGSTAVICGNRITQTGDSGNGKIDYAIDCSGSDLITNNLLHGNHEAGVISRGPGNTPQIINNTIADNGSTGFHAANASPTLKNNILFGTGALGIMSENSAAVASSYNCIHGFTAAYTEIRSGVITGRTGDLLSDPSFDPSSADDYLLTVTSPCIDRGDPAPQFNDLDGSRNDIGYTGGPCSPEGLTPSRPLLGFLFTSVGNIPTDEIGANGLATSGGHQNAPFGKTLQIFGDFARSETSVTHYTLHLGPWSSGAPPSFPADFTPVTDSLRKTFWSGAGVSSKLVVGPHLVAGVPYYARTDNTLTGGFWALENVLTRLDTRGLPDGKYDLALRAYQSSTTPTPGGPPTTPAPVPFSSNPVLTLEINNRAPTVRIVSITKDDLVPIDECAVIKLTPDHSVDHDGIAATPPQQRSKQNLRFTVTVEHPDGFLHSYSLKASVGRNRPDQLIASASYDPAGGISWIGVTNQLHQSIDAMGTGIPPVGGTLGAWESCAYQFTLRATARTTNGYGRIYNATPWNDNLAIDLGALCGPNPDLDGDGDVDGDDLELFSQAYGQPIGN